MTPVAVAVVAEELIVDIRQLAERALKQGDQCMTPRLCGICREANRQASASISLVRSYQRKAEREKTSRKLSRLAKEVLVSAADLKKVLREPCLTPPKAVYQ